MPLEVHSIEVSQLATNCFLAVDAGNREAMIVDPGGDADRIIDGVRRADAVPKVIALTHGHADHVGALAEVAEAFPEAERVCSEVTRDFLSSARLHLGPFCGIEVDPIDIHRLLAEGDTVTLGAYAFTVMEVPGHTPGDVAFYCAPEDGPPVAFTGDTIFAGGVGRVDFPGGDWDTLAQSIRERLYALPENCILYAGHGPATTVAQEKQSNPFVQA